MDYIELQVTTNFSFLRGASHPDEMIRMGVESGYTAMAITDVNSFAGIVRAHAAARGTDLRLIPACRLELLDGPSLLVYPTNKDAYSRLSNLLTTGNLRAEKGECHLYKEDVYAHSKDCIFISLPPLQLNAEFCFDPSFRKDLEEYRAVFGKHLYLAATRRYRGDDQKQLFRLHQLSLEFDVPLVATNDVYYHHPSRRELQDILTCIREKCTIQDAGYPAASKR